LLPLKDYARFLNAGEEMCVCSVSDLKGSLVQLHDIYVLLNKSQHCVESVLILVKYSLKIQTFFNITSKGRRRNFRTTEVLMIEMNEL
jgi:hypothetical protein